MVGFLRVFPYSWGCLRGLGFSGLAGRGSLLETGVCVVQI